MVRNQVKRGLLVILLVLLILLVACEEKPKLKTNTTVGKPITTLPKVLDTTGE